MKKAFLFLISIFLFAPMSYANILLDVGTGYFSDSVTTSSSDTSKKLVYNFAAMLSVSKNLWAGWGYIGLSSDNTTGATNTLLSGYGTGPAFKYQMGRSHAFSISGVFNILSKATYTTTTANEEWSGTSFNIQFAAMPEIYENLYIGVAINYYSASYSKKVVTNTESSVSYSRAWIYPTFNLTKQF